MKKLFVLLLAAVLLSACLAPAAAADNAGAPSREDMRGHGDIAVPKSDSWLSAYETRYVCSSGGVAAFLFYAPVQDRTLVFDNVLDGTELTLLAEQDGFYLVKLADRRVGWVCVGQTAEDNSLLESVPELQDGVWILQKGEGENNTFAVRFGEKRCATVARASDGGKLFTGWVLSGRRVCVDDLYYIWDGENFVSRDEFLTGAGLTRYTLSFDAEGKYEDLFG